MGKPVDFKCKKMLGQIYRCNIAFLAMSGKNKVPGVQINKSILRDSKDSFVSFPEVKLACDVAKIS